MNTTTVEKPTLGLDFRTPHLRLHEALRGLKYSGADRERFLRTDLTRRRVEVSGPFPVFRYGLMLVKQGDIARFELHADKEDPKLSKEEKIRRIRANLDRIEGAKELLREGVISFEGGGVIKESDAVALERATSEAMEQIIEPEFSPGWEFVAQTDAARPSASQSPFSVNGH